MQYLGDRPRSVRRLRLGVKFCYVDESGYGGEPLLVLVGVIVDHTRMHLIKETWQETLGILQARTGQNIREFHAAKFIAGSGLWREIDGADRASIVTDLLDLVVERKHRVVISGVLQDRFDPGSESTHADLRTLWCAGAFHLLLAVQRCHQALRRNKGHTTFVFDREVIEEPRIIELINSPPPWSDSYYQRKRKQAALDQVVDVPYFANSEHVLLIQLADLMSYLVRRYGEINEGIAGPSYADEEERLAGWMEQIGRACIPLSHTYALSGRCVAQDTFWGLAPESVRSIGR